MKASSQNSQAESPKEHSTGNESDEETWDDKLVIDLDTNNMSTADSKVQPKAAASPEAADSDSPSTKTRESNSNSKTSRADGAAPAKQKGKRNGQRKGNEVGTNNKITGKAVKAEKEKTTAGKPGRKKKEKHSPMTVKTEAETTDDPFKFDQSDEKIASTATGKSDGKVKNNKLSKDAQTEYDWRSVAVVTEPENLGPCEPGTQVCLEGIVWQETNNGVLVVNVTWKGKTYMGTLLDATKHDWSPPSCDSPTGDFEGRTPKGRGKRSRVPLSDTFKDINERKLRKEMRKQSGQNQSRPKSPISPKSENGKRKVRNSEGDSSEPTTKRGKGNNSHPQSPPALIECPEPNCGKKYKQMNGLKYHQRNAHRDTSPQVPSDATSDEPEKPEPSSSPETSIKPKTEPEVSDSSITPTKSNSPVRNNTTSVITPTTTNVTNTSAPPAGNVPVATITPQVVKPVTPSAETADQSRSSSNSNQFTSNRSVGISSVPPKLISKPNINNSSMAPISTITSPGSYNSTLKPIQPKPTILGEVAPNPGLHELMDQKKLKRKRSISKEDLGNPPAYGHIDGQKAPGGGMHKYDTEHRGLLSTGGMISSAADPSAVLQSPAYSDISDEGELKNAAARRDLIGRGSLNESHMHSQNLYPIATVSPQKNAPLSDKDGKRTFNRQMLSHSPVPSRPHEEKQKQMPYFPGQSGPWPQEMMMMMMASKEKGSRPVSPKPTSFKPSSAAAASREMEAIVNNDRLQLLKENMAMKGSAMLPRPDGPRDYTVPTNVSNASDYNSFQELKQREMEQDHLKREMMKNLSPASKVQSSAANKLTDNRFEKMPSRSSPMPPPGNFVPPFISNAFLQHQLAAMQMNPLLSRAFPPGMPFPYSHLANMSAENKDNRNSSSPSYAGNSKPNHKIHELEGVQSSKSPRPTSNDRHISSKNQPISSSQAMHSAAAMLPYNGAGMHPSIAGMFQQPK